MLLGLPGAQPLPARQAAKYGYWGKPTRALKSLQLNCHCLRQQNLLLFLLGCEWRNNFGQSANAKSHFRKGGSPAADGEIKRWPRRQGRWCEAAGTSSSRFTWMNRNTNTTHYMSWIKNFSYLFVALFCCLPHFRNFALKVLVCIALPLAHLCLCPTIYL